MEEKKIDEFFKYLETLIKAYGEEVHTTTLDQFYTDLRKAYVFGLIMKNVK